MPYAIALLVLVLVLAWGGFYSLVTCAVGMVASVLAAYCWLSKPRRARELPKAPLVLLAVAFVYLVSSLTSGLTLTTVSETGSWFAIAALSFLVASQDDAGHARLISAVSWVGVATAVAGVLVYSGIIPLPSGMDADRLQFTFQYANAAAAWYGACAFLCLMSPEASLRACALLPAAALLLTESGGGLLVFVLVALCVGIGCARSGEWGRLLAALVQGVAAVTLFVIVRSQPGVPATALALLPAVAACVAYHRWEHRLSGFVRARQTCLLCTGLLALTAVVAVMLLPSRMQEALSTFAERLYQMRDGVSMWLTSPLLGVGPNNWQYLYPYLQTAWYHTTVVHGSYVQMLVDAGPLVVALLVAAVALCLGALRKEARSPWRTARFCASVLLIAHAAIDFDLQFGSLATLMVVLLIGECPDDSRFLRVPVKGLLAGTLCLAVCLPACYAGFRCDSLSSALRAANATGGYDACIELFEGDRWAHGDQSAQDEYLAALYARGDYEQVAHVYEQMEYPSDSSVLYASMSYYGLGEIDRGGVALIEHMEAQPYNDEFFRSAKMVVDAYGLDRVLSGRYNAAVDAANVLISQGSAFLPKRQYLDTYV